DGPSIFYRGARLSSHPRTASDAGSGIALVGCDVLRAPPARHDATEGIDPIGEPVVSEGRPAVRHGQAVQPGLLADARIQRERGETAGAPVPVHLVVGRAFECGVGTRTVGRTGSPYDSGPARRVMRRTPLECERVDQAEHGDRPATPHPDRR